VVSEPIEVQAEESDIYYEYYFESLSNYAIHEDNKFLGTGVSCVLSMKNMQVVSFYYYNGYYIDLNYYVYDDSGIVDGWRHNFYFDFIVNYAESCTGVTWYGEYIYNGDYNYEIESLEWSYNEVKDAQTRWNHVNSISESGYVKTNIPIFNSEKDAVAYINGSIDIKDALNYETDICDIKYDLEAPKNLKIKDVQNTGADGYFNITWEQTDENYKNWQTEIYNYVDFKYRNSVLIFSWADWKYVEDYYAGQSVVDTYKLSYKHSHFKNVEDDELHDRMSEDYPTDYGGIYKIGDEKLYIRNYYYDGTYKHYSNWIVLEFDSEEDAWMNPEMNSTVVEKEGSELDVDDNGVPIQPDSNVVQDSEYTGGVNENYERVDGTDLISWIKNGFGLGGDNGVLGMMGESFSFIPGEIWAVFAAGISMMVVVAVFKFIRG
jgi:hypothetical protein